MSIDAIENLSELAGERLKLVHKGKVRETFELSDSELLIVSSDRFSAFDRILTTVPHKGNILSALSALWFRETSSLVPNHFLDLPFPNCMRVKRCEMLPVELIVRGYLCGSAWRDYKAGKKVSGVELPSGMQEFQKFPEPIITPSTKAEVGDHDEPISEVQLVERGLVSEENWSKAKDYALKLFNFAQHYSAERGLLFVDTKYEFGLVAGELVIADEIHTPDSSRFWEAESFEERVSNGAPPVMRDKEVVRRWLIEQGFMGEGEPPSFSDERRMEISANYERLYEQLAGAPLVKASSESLRLFLEDLS